MKIDRFDVLLPRSDSLAGGQGVSKKTALREGHESCGGADKKGPSFDSLLEQQLRGVADRSDVRISSHAMSRMESRKIPLGADDLCRLSAALDQLQLKGGKESLVLSNEAAFVVNVPGRTIITALDRNEMRDRAFTNIDSAMIM